MDERATTTGKRLLTLVPCAALALGWRLAYNLLGYGAGNSSLYLDPLAEPTRFASAVATRLPLLMQGQLTPLPSETGHFFQSAATPILVLSVGTLILCTAICAKRVKASPLMRFAVAGMLIGAIPLCAVFAADRVLLPVGIGGSLLIANVLAAAKEELNLAERGLAKFWFVAHLILAPLAVPTRVYSIELFGAAYRNAAMSLDRAGDLSGKTLMVASAPDFLWAAPAPFTRKIHGKSCPDRLRIVSTAISGSTIKRIDERTLELTANNHLLESDFDTLLRHPARGWTVGREVHLDDGTITITKLTSEGRLKQIRWSQTEPLVGPKRAWVIWTKDGYQPFELPAIGQSRDAPPVSVTNLMQYRYTK